VIRKEGDNFKNMSGNKGSRKTNLNRYGGIAGGGRFIIKKAT